MPHRGRSGHPEVLADLRRQHKIGKLGAGEEQIGAERSGLPAENGLADALKSRGKVAPLVKLAIGRQIAFGDHAEQNPVLKYGGAVVELPARRNGKAGEYD